MVRVFASELSRCRKMKLLIGFFLSLSLFVIFVVFPIAWFVKAPVPKTGKDFVWEYVMKRYNYTPDTVKKALRNDLQFIFPLYDDVVRDEEEFARKMKLYQEFLPIEITKKGDKYMVFGRRIRFICNQNLCSKEEKKITVVVKEASKGKFIVEEERE